MNTNHNAGDSQGHSDQPSRGTLRAVDHLAMYDVVLLWDEGHTYGFVTTMLCGVFGVSPQRALELAAAAERDGRVVCCTTHKERAEFKREQVECFGSDGPAGGAVGAMRAVIEACKESTGIAPRGA